MYPIGYALMNNLATAVPFEANRPGRTRDLQMITVEPGDADAAEWRHGPAEMGKAATRLDMKAV